mgnify:CR=1 FL=1|tara:strand:- start:546 stop:1796 length:1251 start_codon:yes stop_codon:yes gene_type:complete
MTNKFLKFKTRVNYWIPYLFLYFLSIPFLLIIRLLKFIFIIRIHHVGATRIGHFAGEMGMYFCMQKANLFKFKKKTVDIHFFNETCNHQLIKMVQRVLPLFFGRLMWPIYKANKSLNIRAFEEFKIEHRDTKNLLDKYPSSITFTEEEKYRGDKELEKLGVPKNAKIICFSVRDKAYLKDLYPDKDWSYHDYRDANIDNYVLATEELANRGYYVFRMGAKVLKPLRSQNPKIIDYALSNLRSEFLDIYITSRSTFVLGQNMVINLGPWLFRKPMIQDNMIPVGLSPSYCKNFLVIPKKYFDETKKRELTLSEIAKLGLFYTTENKDFKKNGIKLIENSPEEIRDVCIEMEEKLSGKLKYSQEDLNLQKNFWNNFKKNAQNNKDIRYGVLGTFEGCHGQLFGNYGKDFLKKNPNWLK